MDAGQRLRVTGRGGPAQVLRQAAKPPEVRAFGQIEWHGLSLAPPAARVSGGGKRPGATVRLETEVDSVLPAGPDAPSCAPSA
ncbi:hypothetical protein GCM10023259_097500 [Thermocatellispora tengchongensis]